MVKDKKSQIEDNLEYMVKGVSRSLFIIAGYMAILYLPINPKPYIDKVKENIEYQYNIYWGHKIYKKRIDAIEESYHRHQANTPIVHNIISQ